MPRKKMSGNPEKMPGDELIANLGQLLAGLAVPVSMEMPLGRAGAAWVVLHGELIGFGWAGPEDYEAALRDRLGLPARTQEQETGHEIPPRR